LTGQIPDLQMSAAANKTAHAGVVPFLRLHKLHMLFLSAIVVAPCIWHRRIEAGDLASHAFNAWLAQLIAKGQAPGLYIVGQWHNILFDVMLLRTANLVGIAAAEKIVVSLCVLIFFWESSRSFERLRNGRRGLSPRASPCWPTGIPSAWVS